MIIALAGLPGSGKSYLAKAVCKKNGDYVLFDKDTVRQTLFPDGLTDFSSEQDDLCIDVIFRSAAYLLEKNKDVRIFIDGRTFSKKYQVQAVLDAARKMRTSCKFIECVCSDDVARKRLFAGKGAHYAKNRTFDLYTKLQKTADPLEVPHLTLCTDDETKSAERIEAVLAYIAE